MDGVEEVLAAGLLVLLAGVVAAGMLAFWAFRRVRREAGRRRTLLQLRAIVARRGHAREIAQLRVHLQRAVESARAAAAALASERRSSEARGLMRRLSRIASALDDELRLLAKEPDPAVQGRLLGEARLRVREAVGVASMVRGAAATILWGDTDAELAALAKDAALEMAAAQAGAMTGIGWDVTGEVQGAGGVPRDRMLEESETTGGFQIDVAGRFARAVRTARDCARAARTLGNQRS